MRVYTTNFLFILIVRVHRCVNGGDCDSRRLFRCVPAANGQRGLDNPDNAIFSRK
jgi:hypothetical protein